MPNEEAVKTDQAAAPGAVESQPNAAEVDYEAVVSQLLDENKKLATERENYRKGMLQAKGKTPKEAQATMETAEDLDAMIDRKVQEKMLGTQQVIAAQKLEETVKSMAKQLKEAKLALANKAGASTTVQPNGSSDLKPTTDNFFSPEKLAALKAKGWDDKKIEMFKKNLAKARG